MTTLIFIERLLFPLIATLAGAWLAFRNMRNKQKSDDEKQKLSNAYRWFLEAENCIFSLYQLKKSYNSISDNSIYRSLKLKTSNAIYHKVDAKDVTNLAFLLEQDFDIDRLGFRNYFRIARLFQSYNQAIKNWEEIHKIKPEINNKIELLLNKNSKFQIDGNFIEAVTPSKLTNYILLFEQTTSLTELCISDFLKFLDDFPAIINKSIDFQLASRKPMKKLMHAPEVALCLEKQFKELTQEQYDEVREIIPNHKK